MMDFRVRLLVFRSLWKASLRLQWRTPLISSALADIANLTASEDLRINCSSHA